ncbi:MAG TPA: hypothetical protein VNH18_37030 [Bryobacteraceae bacterium]|nr:hypothetical protein [Bryobacteraceae bacterium]
MRLCALVFIGMLVAGEFAGETTAGDGAVRALDEGDARRESQLVGYSVTEHYTLVVHRLSQTAEMTVETVYRRGQGKTFHVDSRSGSSTLQSRVFDRLLSEEGEMSRGEGRRHTLVNSENYGARLTGEAEVAGRQCYVLELTPRVKSTHLLQGRAWIDQADGSLIRIEGRPGASPSFLTGRPMISREYERVGDFWLARVSRSVTESLVFGKTDLSIEYRDYRILE